MVLVLKQYRMPDVIVELSVGRVAGSSEAAATETAVDVAVKTNWRRSGHIDVRDFCQTTWQTDGAS